MRAPCLAVVLAVAALAPGCGGDDNPATPTPTTAKPRPVRAVDTPCRGLRTMAAAERVADKLSYLLIAPPDHSQREVSGTLAQSLFHTCRQPKIPGVADPLDYKPAKPLITQIQADFDEEMASGH